MVGDAVVDVGVVLAAAVVVAEEVGGADMTAGFSGSGGGSNTSPWNHYQDISSFLYKFYSLFSHL